MSIGWIEGCATVPTLDNMVGEHPMTRSRLLAPLPLDNSLTSISSTLENCGAPLAMFRSEEFRIGGFRRRFDRARIDSAQPDPHHFDLRHFWNHHQCGEADRLLPALHLGPMTPSLSRVRYCRLVLIDSATPIC